MQEERTNLRCSGCDISIPQEKYSTDTKRSTWFGSWNKGVLTEWVCVNCWDKGIRYKNYKDYKNVPLEELANSTPSQGVD